MNSPFVAPASAGTTRPWRRALMHGLLAMALTVSGVADAYTLEGLLRLPLERLLELRIDAQRVSQGAGPRPSRSLPTPGDTHAA